MRAVDPLGPDTESVTFELDRLQRDGDRGLVVRGRWSGIRGRRFVRPTLTMRIDGANHRLLADLEHKPWAAEEGEEWVALFSPAPPAGEVEEIELSVAPDITVSLAGSGPRRSSAPVKRRASAPASASATPDAGTTPRRAPRRKPESDSSRTAFQEERAKAEELSRRLEDTMAGQARLVAERDALRVERDELRVERDALLVERDGMRRQHARARKRVTELQRERKALEANANAGLSEARDLLEAERAETTRLRGALETTATAAGERDRLARQLDTLAEERNRLAAQAGGGARPPRPEGPIAPRPIPPHSSARRRGPVWVVRAAALAAMGAVVLAFAIALHLI
ncbi:MAG TPA: hypothetical protein VG295_11550 [Solirubrobacteraceae bacterium]|nr:hypothetical protein [Solirubrobacteraceae bacterium]